MDDERYDCPGEEYAIPFRCLYSRNIGNLMMAGRNISATHLALSNSRVMLTCALLGHAAGTGAALCVRNNTRPRGLYAEHIQTLQQQLLKEGAYVMGVEADDPADLAPKARVRASSERTFTTGEVMAAAQVVNGMPRAIGDQTNAWSPCESASAPHWIELAWDESVSFNVVHVAFQTAALAPDSFALEARSTTGWEHIAEVCQNRHRRHVLGLDRTVTDRLRVVMTKPRGISDIRVYEESPRDVEGLRRAHQNMRLPDEGPFLPWEEGFALDFG